MESKHDHRPISSPLRPYFSPRQELTALQLNGILEEELWRSRLLNRALYGYGVVFGYQLKLRRTQAERPRSDAAAPSVQMPAEPQEPPAETAAPGVYVQQSGPTEQS